MITKIFKYESENLVEAVHLPKEYGYYQIVVELRSFHLAENMPDNYINTLRERFLKNPDKEFLIVVKQTFDKEKWTEYYKQKQLTDLCPCCSQPVPAGYYDKSLKDAEARSKTYWGFKIVDEKYLIVLLESGKKFFNDVNPVDNIQGSFGSYPINLPIEIIEVNE